MRESVKLDQQSFKKVKQLVRACANYADGDCLLLDNDCFCPCVQEISLSLCCKYFENSVLPLDNKLYASLKNHSRKKKCAACGEYFIPASNRAKYCPGCSERAKKSRAAERKRKQRYGVTL